MASFSERLRELRKSKNIGQKEVGAILGVSESSIGKYEAGDRTPSPEAIVKLSRFFEVTTDYLLGETNDPKGNKILTIAAHRSDNPMDDLPPEAEERVQEFIELMRIKYGKKKT